MAEEKPLVSCEAVIRSNKSGMSRFSLKKRSFLKSGEGADGEKETLHSLARRGNTQEIRVLLQQNEDIDKRDSYGKTPLHCAVSAGQLAAVKYLLHCHANPNLKDHREEAPLHAAVRTGNVDVVEALLNHKATNVNIEGRNKYTPLHIAAYLEHRNALEICQKLLDGGANVTLRGSDHMTPLSVATMKGAHETMELFFKKSHELQNDPKKSMDILYSVDYEGSTLLHLAIDSGSLKAVLLCLDQGCSLTAIRRVDGGSPIHLACRLGALDIVQCLHQHDPSTFISILLDREGMTPLHRAAMFNHEGVVRFIIEQGLDLNPRDKEKCTPLLLAAAHGCSNVVSLLLDKGADVSCKDDKNRTALHWAVGQDKTIEGLLDDPRVQSLQLVNDQDSTGSTTLHYAAQGGFLKSVLLLLKNGADPSLKNHKLETPLHLAASHGWLPIVKKLMEGRQTRLMNVGNLSDHTPLHLAASNGQEKVVKFLLDRGATIERDTEGRTALHFAAAKGSLRSVQLICMANPNCINDEDNADQDTSLHLAAKNGHSEVVDFLLSDPNQKITYNGYNQNGLDVAIEAGRENVVMVIANHTRWREMCHRVEEGLTQLQHLVIKMPSAAEKFLDRCVEECGAGKDEDYSVTFDFMFLQGMPDIRKDDPKKFLDCLHTMVKYKRVNCLSHQVCGAIMNIKWRSVGWKAYVMNLTFYLIFLLLLTSMTIMLDARIEDNLVIDIPKYTIIVMSLFHLLKELFQIWDEKFKYLLKADNWMEWFLYMSSLVYMIQYEVFDNHVSVTGETRPLAATAIFIAWVIFVLYLRRFSTFGIYIIMMTNIIKTLIKIIILFIPFVIAFGIPFFLLLKKDYYEDSDTTTSSTNTNNNITAPNSTNSTAAAPQTAQRKTDTQFLFDELPYSLFTTFMLILGEMKYPHTVYKYQPIPNPWISYIIYIIFCVCMPIIIKNLLIGLSVGDVNRILQTAKMEQHAMQVELLLELERATPRRVLRKIWVAYFVDFPNRNKTWKQKLMEFGSPKRTAANQETYINPALLSISDNVQNLTAKVEQQEDKLKSIVRLLNRMDSRLTDLASTAGPRQPPALERSTPELSTQSDPPSDPPGDPDNNRETSSRQDELRVVERHAAAKYKGQVSMV
ncbi:transient receptor potential cation channel subfamily A member 1 isoform X2 [Nematostella vectensis]|uniref:transient receptor potential cation channel subfamily A member 1 isoform X2 n=1 Tax=Nematostella vectensis TaxID=45351 RepID=UPI00138FF656|nr:transient receptor potential cation channel subfamily A member 1 isoform X2 [Nematostella vectensis]